MNLSPFVFIFNVNQNLLFLNNCQIDTLIDVNWGGWQEGEISPGINKEGQCPF
jgi:hypothetical protein